MTLPIWYNHMKEKMTFRSDFIRVLANHHLPSQFALAHPYLPVIIMHLFHNFVSANCPGKAIIDRDGQSAWKVSIHFKSCKSSFLRAMFYPTCHHTKSLLHCPLFHSSLTKTGSCISTKRVSSVAGTCEASNSIVAYLSTPSIVS